MVKFCRASALSVAALLAGAACSAPGTEPVESSTEDLVVGLRVGTTAAVSPDERFAVIAEDLGLPSAVSLVEIRTGRQIWKKTGEVIEAGGADATSDTRPIADARKWGFFFQPDSADGELTTTEWYRWDGKLLGAVKTPDYFPTVAVTSGGDAAIIGAGRMAHRLAATGESVLLEGFNNQRSLKLDGSGKFEPDGAVLVETTFGASGKASDAVSRKVPLDFSASSVNAVSPHIHTSFTPTVGGKVVLGARSGQGETGALVVVDPANGATVFGPTGMLGQMLVVDEKLYFSEVVSRDPYTQAIKRWDPTTGQATLLSTEEGALSKLGLSKDGKFVVLQGGTHSAYVLAVPRDGGALTRMTSSLPGVYDGYCDVAFDKVACATEENGKSVVRVHDMVTHTSSRIALPPGATSFAGQSAGYTGTAWQRSHVVVASPTKIFAQTLDELYMLDGQKVTRLDETLAAPGHGLVSWRVLEKGLLYSEGPGPEHDFDYDHPLPTVKYRPFPL